MYLVRSFFAAAIIFIAITATDARSDDALSIFDRTTDLVNLNFYDQTFRGLPWPKLVKQYRKKLSANSSDEHLQRVLNGLLLSLV